MAVLSDEIACGVRDNCVDWKEGPNIPRRSRFEMLYGKEIEKTSEKNNEEVSSSSSP